MIRQVFSSNRTTQNKQALLFFQQKLISALSQIIERQDKGNILLQKMLERTNFNMLINNSSNINYIQRMKAQSQYNISEKSQLKAPTIQVNLPQSNTYISHQSYPANFTSKDQISISHQTPYKANLIEVYDEELQRKIQMSKRKLALNKQQLLRGVDKALHSLDSKRSITPSLVSNQFQSHASSFPNKYPLTNRSQYNDYNKYNERQKHQYFLSQAMSEDQKKFQNKAQDKNLNAQIYGISDKAKSQNQKTTNFNQNPTINFTGDNITIQNSRIKINIQHQGFDTQGQKEIKKDLMQHDQQKITLNNVLGNLAKFQQSLIVKDTQYMIQAQKKLQAKKSLQNSSVAIDGRQRSPTFNQPKIDYVSKVPRVDSINMKIPTKQKQQIRQSNKSIKQSNKELKKSSKRGKDLKKTQFKDGPGSSAQQTLNPNHHMNTRTASLQSGYHRFSSDHLSSLGSKKNLGESDENQNEQKKFGYFEPPQSSKFGSSKAIKKQLTIDSSDSYRFKKDQRDRSIQQTQYDIAAIIPSNIVRQSNKTLKSQSQLFKSTTKLNIPWTLIGKQLGLKPANQIPISQLDTIIGNFNNLKQYSRLNEVQPYSDKRQMKVRVSFYEMFINAGIRQIKGRKQFQSFISQWLGITYRTTASIGWNMLNNRRLDFEEVKILFTENIIFNYIELMKDIRKLGLYEFQTFIPQIVNIKTIDIINFLCKQYPQTKVEAPNMALRNQIPSIDEKGRIQYQLVRSSNVKFILKKGADYASQIMMFINYLIDVSNQHYDNFENFFSKLFNKLYLPQAIRNQNKKETQNSNNAAYMQKVKKYTKFLIGRKIPKNTPKYTQQQIQNGMFFIKSSAILRVISKWVQDLIQMVKKPDVMIRDWFHPFKNHQGNEQYAEYPIRKGIYNKIMENKSQFYQKIQSIRKTCYKIQGQLSQQIHISDDNHSHLGQQQMNVGLFASNIKNALSSFLCQQLNQVIHFLLAAPINVNQKKIGVAEYFEDRSRNQLDSINLITFRIFDLLRCKCVSGQAQILWLIDQLKKMDKNEKSYMNTQQFTVIRFKDRLNQGSRDILINLQIRNGPVSQLQLSVTNQVEQKQDLLDKYNHFLYQLKRATMLGPLIQNVSIWTSLQQKSTYFDQVVQNKFKNSDKVVPFVHKCHLTEKQQQKTLLKLMQPMTCVSCHLFFHIPKTCLLNWYCSKCKATVCGQCLFAGLSSDQRKKRLFNRSLMSKQMLSVLKQFIPQQRPKQIPKFAFFFKKKELKAQLNYMTSYMIQSTMQQEKIIKCVQTIIKGDKIINRSLISNYQEIKKLKDYIIFEYNPHGNRQYMTLHQIQQLQIKNEKLRIVNLLQEPNYIENIRQISNPKKKIKLFADLQKIIGDKKIQVLRFKKIMILIQVHMDYNELQAQLVRHQNYLKLKQFSETYSSVISIQRKNMTTQMNMIKEQLGKQIYDNLQNHVTKAYLNYGLMQNIQSLSFLTLLQSLSISDNRITSLKGIQKLTKLKILNFDRNLVDSLQPIKPLVKLEYLMGNQNKLKSMKEISLLKKLKQISLHQNKISKLQSLEFLSELQILYVTNNQIQSINQVKIPKKLQQLTLSGNKINDFKNLEYLNGLKFLSLSQLKIQVIPQEIEKLISLQELDLSFNLIQKMEHFDKLLNLKKLKMKNNRLTQIQNLDNLKITHLNVESNQITKLTGLINILDTIEELNIRKNQIQDIGDLNDIQIEFKILWTKSSFKPKARFALQSAFKNTISPMGLLTNMLKTTNLKASIIGESMDFGQLGN